MTGHTDIRIIRIDNSQLEARCPVRALAYQLLGRKLHVRHLSELVEGVAPVGLGQPDIVRLDLILLESADLESLNRIAQLSLKPPVIVLANRVYLDLTAASIILDERDVLVTVDPDTGPIARSFVYAIEHCSPVRALQREQLNVRAIAESCPQDELIGSGVGIPLRVSTLEICDVWQRAERLTPNLAELRLGCMEWEVCLVSVASLRDIADRKLSVGLPQRRADRLDRCAAFL